MTLRDGRDPYSVHVMWSGERAKLGRPGQLKGGGKTAPAGCPIFMKEADSRSNELSNIGGVDECVGESTTRDFRLVLTR